MNYQNKKFKENSPYQTIQQINEILLKHNLLPSIYWNNNSNNLYSCSCSLMEIPSISSNGKGTDAAYAQASAMAEFLERLQSFYLLKPEKKADIVYSDDKDGKRKFICLNSLTESYFSDFDLPQSSTGLAAGNTYLEAISQGLCEIFERYCITEFCKKTLFFTKELSLPPEFFWITKKVPGTIKLYDISLNTGIPCVLLIYYLNNDMNRCGLSFGCAQTINLAIERVITEFFQGHNINKLSNQNNFSVLINDEDFEVNLFDLYSLHSGLIPKTYITSFLSNRKMETVNSQFLNISSHEEFIKTFLQNTKNLLGNIYVKFIGFLNFPTVILFCDEHVSVDYFSNKDKNFVNHIIEKKSKYYTDSLLKTTSVTNKNFIIDHLARLQILQTYPLARNESFLLDKMLKLNLNYIPDYSCLKFLI